MIDGFDDHKLYVTGVNCNYSTTLLPLSQRAVDEWVFAAVREYWLCVYTAMLYVVQCFTAWICNL